MMGRFDAAHELGSCAASAGCPRPDAEQEANPFAASSSYARMVAGRLGQPGPLAGGLEDLVQPGRRQRLAPPWAFNTNEDSSVPASEGRSASR
jgi:hypothetical protein